MRLCRLHLPSLGQQLDVLKAQLRCKAQAAEASQAESHSLRGQLSKALDSCDALAAEKAATQVKLQEQVRALCSDDLILAADGFCTIMGVSSRVLL